MASPAAPGCGYGWYTFCNLLMYLDFEDSRPEFSPVGRAISWREGILLSIIVHLAAVIMLLVAPRLFPNNGRTARESPLLVQPDEEKQFVFVQPRLDTPALRPPPRAEPSDKDRIARSRERAPIPNPEPLSRGNTSERVEAEAPQPPPAPAAPGPPAPPAAEEETPAPKLPESTSAMQLPAPLVRPPQISRGGGGGALGDALNNLQKYVQRDQFDNPQGGGGEPGAAIQFDSKGVEFGPWLRRFVAQIKRNWFIPYAAMSMKGHVVITFNVHKDGAITDLSVVGPCPIEAFNNAAFGALVGSNPTQPLPTEYPSDKAFFTVTFYYNERLQ